MSFDISLWDLGIWFAFSSIIMLLVSEVVSPYYGRTNVLLEIKKMRKIAIGFGIAFIIIASLKAASL